MKVLVCIKPVPDPASRLVINDSKTWIKDRDLTFVSSEADNYALEEALRLKEKHGGEVVAISLGGAAAVRVLRSALATGADRAIHLADPRFEMLDEFRVAEALVKAIQKDGGADLVLAGVQSDDLGTGATGVMLAEFLAVPHATVVIALEADAASRFVRVKRELEGGVAETVEIDLPGVLTIQYGINQPRYASLKGIMAAKKKPLVAWGADELGLSEWPSAGAAALSEVRTLVVPERVSKTEIIGGTPEEAAASLVEKLRREAKVL